MFFKKNHAILVLGLLLTLANQLHAEPTNIALLKEQVRQYHDSGQYNTEIRTISQQAQKFLEKRAKQNATQPKPQKLAIIFDIDETTLSNYKNICQLDFTNKKEKVQRLVRKADGQAIKPMLDLYQAAIKNNVTIFFISGRPEVERDVTEKNLKQAGYPIWQYIYLRPANDTQSSVIPFKTKARKTIAKQGYTIIASVGDQYSDLIGGYSEQSYKLPNPFYFIP